MKPETYRFWNSFVRTAKVGELFARRDHLYEVRRSGPRDQRRLARQAIRMINEELEIRAAVAAARRRRS